MDTLSTLQTKLRETIERYRTELPGTETSDANPDRTAASERTPTDDTDSGGTDTEATSTGTNETDGADGNERTKTNEDATTGGANRNRNRNGSRGTTENESESESEWHAVESPTKKALYGVVHTARGPFAVGTGGLLLARGKRGWNAVVEAGPATRENRLTAIDATDDGKRIWFCGSSGALGAYDVEAGRKYDYSAPKDKTSTWEAIAVSGNVGSETIRVANGSGEVLPASTDGDGCPQWEEVTKPGSGSTISALDFGGGVCYAADTSGNVFAERDDGWADIGIENAQVNFFDLLATDRRVLVSGGGGRMYRYDRACRNWTPIEVGEGALHAIAGSEGTIAVVGAGGQVNERTGAGWQRVRPVSEDLFSITFGESGPDVACGANGTIVERTSGGEGR